MATLMQEPTFLILTALTVRPLHGYAIIADVAETSGGRVRLRTGTLYAALERLLAEGSIESDREEVVGGRLRRYYRISDAGLARLEEEAIRLRSNAEAATSRIDHRLGRTSAALRPGSGATTRPAGGLA